MNRVILIDPCLDSRWDTFVERHPFGWVTHLSAWKRVLENSFPNMKGYYLVLIDENGEIKAGLPIYEVRSLFRGDRLISIPFATFSDPLVSDEQEFKILFDHVKNNYFRNNFSNLEIRMFNYDCQFDYENIYPNLFVTHVLNLSDGIEELKKKFHKTCVRRNISRANRNELKLRMGVSEEDWMVFFRLYVANRKRLGLPSHPYNFISNIRKYLQEKVNLLLGEWNKKVIGALVLFKYKNRVSAEYLGTDEKFKKFYINVFLYWEAIKWAFECNAKYFDFGRTAPTNRGLMEFKGHWGTKLLNLPIFYYPKSAVIEKNFNEQGFLYKLAHLLFKATPEVFHPYLGEIIYKYLY